MVGHAAVLGDKFMVGYTAVVVNRFILGHAVSFGAGLWWEMILYSRITIKLQTL